MEMNSNNNTLAEDSVVESDLTISSMGMSIKEMVDKIQKLEVSFDGSKRHLRTKLSLVAMPVKLLDMLKKLMDGTKNGGDQYGMMDIMLKIGEKFGKMKKEMSDIKEAMAKKIELEELKKAIVGLKEEMAKMKKEMEEMEEMKKIVDELKASNDEEERKVAEIQEYHKRMQEEAEENNSVGEVDQEEEAVAMEQDQNAQKKYRKIQLKKGTNNFSKIKKRHRRPPLKSYYCVTTIDGSEKLQDAATGELVSFDEELD